MRRQHLDARGDASTTARVAAGQTVLRVRAASLSLGGRTLWRDLNLRVQAGEFLAVLGANGAGKTSFLRAILGQQRLDGGSIELDGSEVRRGDRRIGYVPQQRLLPPDTPMRARDLVCFGVDGHRFGMPWYSRAHRHRVNELMSQVGATRYANEPIGTLSGGEQQRLRIAQALATDPILLLCDEPLLSLDLHHQRGVSELIDQHRRQRLGAVLFVTHDINPVLGMVDRVLYLAGGKAYAGTPDEVLRSDTLTNLYGTPVEVIRSKQRVLVAGVPDAHARTHDWPSAADTGSTA